MNIMKSMKGCKCCKCKGSRGAWEQRVMIIQKLSVKKKLKI